MNLTRQSSQSKIILYGALLILALACVLRLHYAQFKDVFHMDEILSITLAEYNEYGWTKPFEGNKLYEAGQMQEAILWNDSTLSGALADVGRLWLDNRDSPHTNLYYSLLRLWHIGFSDTHLKHIFYRALGLNFVFLLCAFSFAFMLALQLFRHGYVVLCFLALGFLNPAGISNTLFLRPYALQEAAFFGFCFVLFKVLAHLKNPTQAALDRYLKCVNKSKRYIKLWSVGFALFLGVCAIFVHLSHEVRYAEVVVSEVTQEGYEGKMIFTNPIFREHKPYITLEPLVDSMIFAKTFAPMSFSTKERARYLEIHTGQMLSQGESLGVMPYKIYVQPSFFVLLAICYVLGCVLILCIPLISTQVALLALSSSILLLSGYFAAIFVIGVFALATLWKWKLPHNRLFFLTSLVYSLLLCTLLYPKYLFAFSGYRAQEAGDKLSIEYLLSHFGENTRSFFDIVLNATSWSVIIVSICGIWLCVIYSIRHFSTLKAYFRDFSFFPLPIVAFILGICALLWAYMVIYIAPFKDLRYVMSAFGLIMLVCAGTFESVLVLISLYGRTYARFLKVGACIIALCCTWSVIPTQKHNIASINNSNFLISPTYQAMSLPSVVFVQDYVYYASLILPYLPPQNKVIFINDCKDLSALVALYGEIEYISDENPCPLQIYQQRHLYSIATLKSIVLKS